MAAWVAPVVGSVLGSIVSGLFSAGQPGSAQMQQQGQGMGGQSSMPNPTPGGGQEEIDWEKIFAMLAQQSTPPLYNVMPQLYQGIPMGQQQQGMGDQ